MSPPVITKSASLPLASPFPPFFSSSPPDSRAENLKLSGRCPKNHLRRLLVFYVWTRRGRLCLPFKQSEHCKPIFFPSSPSALLVGSCSGLITSPKSLRSCCCPLLCSLTPGEVLLLTDMEWWGLFGRMLPASASLNIFNLRFTDLQTTYVVFHCLSSHCTWTVHPPSREMGV